MKCLLAESLAMQDKVDEADELLSESYTVFESGDHKRVDEVAAVVERIVRFYDNRKEPGPAAQWRENQKELRLIGTRCKHCGTPQYPPQRVCINCKKKDEMEPYGFADREAKLLRLRLSLAGGALQRLSERGCRAGATAR